MKVVRNICRALFIWRYPGYVARLYQKYVLPRLVVGKGVQLGDDVSFIGVPIVSIVPGSSIKIGSNAVLCSKSERTALGVNHPIVLRTLRKGACLEIGQGVRMSGTTICASKHVAIGDRTCLGANVTISDTDFHALDPVIRSSASDHEMAVTESVEIGKDVFIGAGCYILKGVSIGEGAVVGAGSVVTGNIPAFAVAAGNPARILRAVPGHSLPDCEDQFHGKK